MPVAKMSKESVQVQLGTGDILIGSGMTGDFEHGIISFIPQEPKEIGSYVKHENPYKEIEEIPVSLTFKNTHSLDILIDRLNKTRKYMTGELDIKKEIKEW